MSTSPATAKTAGKSPAPPQRPLSRYRRRCGHTERWLWPCFAVEFEFGAILLVSARAAERHNRCAACRVQRLIDEGLLFIRGNPQIGFWLVANAPFDNAGAHRRARLLYELTQMVAPGVDLPEWPDAISLWEAS